MTLSRLFVSVRPSLVALALALSAGAAVPTAIAQQGGAKPATVTKELVAPLNEGLKAMQAKDYATAKLKLDAGAAIAKTPNDIYQVEQLRVIMAAETKDNANLLIYLQNALNTNLVPADDVKRYKYAFVTAYAGLNDNPKVVSSLRAYVDEFGGTADQYGAIAQELLKTSDPAGVTYTEKALGAERANGGKASEGRLKLALRAYTVVPDAGKYTSTLEEMITNYPKDDYWRQFVADTQKAPGFTAATRDMRLDVFRALHATGIALKPQEISGYGEEAAKRGLPNEAVTVLTPISAQLDADTKDTLANATKLAKDDKAGLAKEEKDALAKGSADRLVGLGEAMLTYEDYAKAAEMIQKGLDKGIADPGKADIARLHLGIAQYRSGQKEAAQATWAQIKSDNGTTGLARVWTFISKTKG